MASARGDPSGLGDEDISQTCYSSGMDRVGKVFRSFDAADAADDQFYADLKPEERLDLLLELVERHRSDLGEAASRLERVHRVIELSQR
jgi:hypothetical protein